MERTRVKSASPFEDTIAFSRGIRVGERCLISGTGPIWPDGSCPDDVEVQARRCLAIIAAALEGLGATMADVVRTRMYLVDPADAPAVGRAHHDAFGSARPAATMIVIAGLLDPRWRVEIEAEAVVGEPAG